MTVTSTDHDKLYFTLNIFRACRILDYKFIAKTPIQSLLQLPTNPGELIRGEILQLYNLPFIVRGKNDQFLKPYIEELPTYKSICIAYVNAHENEEEDDTVQEEEEKGEKRKFDNYLEFWKQNVLELPTFSQLSRKILSCSPSSATVERLFSLLTCFDDKSSSALADMAKARAIMRYNHNFRNRKRD